MSTTSTTSSLLTHHSRSLTYYKTALTTANARIQTLESTLSSLQTQLTTIRAEAAHYRDRCADLDRDARVRMLELKAALRAKRAADAETEKLRAELQSLRERDATVPMQRGWGSQESAERDGWKTAPESPTDYNGEEETGRGGGLDAVGRSEDDSRLAAATELAQLLHEGHTGEGCECEAVKAVRVLYRRGGFMTRDGERPKRTALRLKLREAGERVGRRSRAEILQGIVGEFEEEYVGSRGERTWEVPEALRDTMGRREGVR